MTGRKGTTMSQNDPGSSRQENEQAVLAVIRSRKSPKIIKDQLENYHENDIAEALPLLTKTERESLYRLLSTDMLADVMEHIDEEDAAPYLEEMDPRRAAGVLEKMEPDDAVDLLKNTDSPAKKAWMELMTDEARKSLVSLASYSEDTIGSRMTTNFVTLTSSLSIREAMNSVISQAAKHDNISSIYVLDETGVFYGEIDLKDLIIARQGTKLEDIIATAYPYVYADEKIDECIETIKQYSEESIPVLSEDNHILGVITSQDVVEVVDDEMGEDYAKLGGLTDEEDLNEPLRQSIRKRLPWLILLLFLGMGVSSVVSMFEAVVAQLTFLMMFQSMILDMSGNVGTQSLAVTIRVLMDEHLTGKQKAHLIFKECRIGLFNGLLLAVIAFAAIGLYLMAFRHMTPLHAFAVSACIGLALILAMLISSFVGTAVPMFFKAVGVDPAVASGPLITTITDLVGVVSYYGMAWIILIGILHMG